MYIWISSSALILIGRIRSSSNFLTPTIRTGSLSLAYSRPLHPETRTHRFYAKVGPLPHPTLRIYSPQGFFKHALVHGGFVGVTACSLERHPVFDTFLVDPNIGRFLKHDGSSLALPLTGKAILARAKEMTHFFWKRMVTLSTDGLGASNNPV